jgi:copper chaperone CopZ
LRRLRGDEKMAETYEFHILDVTCEKCEVRLKAALGDLTGVEDVKLVRTPEDEADVILTAGESLVSALIEQVVEAASAGTDHDYRVRWESR